MHQWFYSPYGEILNRSGTNDIPYQWCVGVGVAREPSGLYYMKARYYHPELKRWITVDPIGLAGGINMYAYAALNPLMYFDPMGLCAEGSWNIMTRVGGAAQMLGGAAEATAGYVLGAATSPTIVGGIAGAAVGTHGLDNVQAGFRQMVSGQAVDTITSQAMQDFGVDRNIANMVDAGLSMLFTAGASSLNSAAKASSVVSFSDDATLPLVDRYYSPQAASSKMQYWRYNRAGRTGQEITDSIVKANLDDVLRTAKDGEVFIPPETAKEGAKYFRALEALSNWPR